VYIFPSGLNTATSNAVIVSQSVKLDGVIAQPQKLTNPSANCPLPLSNATFPLSPAQLEVFTKTSVSVVSISKSNTSAPAGSIIVFFNQSPAVSLSSSIPVVVSVALIATF